MNRNLKPGDFVTLIPIGLQTTLQYNTSGNLEKVFIGFKDKRRDVTDTFLPIILNTKKVPAKISLQNGTSWISGILYTNSTIKKFGMLPAVIESDLENHFIKNPQAFNFFAGLVECTAVNFSGCKHIYQYLHFAKFNVLPGYYVPAVFNESVMTEWMNQPGYTFLPIVTDFIVFRDVSTTFMSNGVSQCTVSKVKRYVDDNGYLKVEATLTSDHESEKLYFHYTEAAKYGIEAGTTLYFDSKKQVFYSKDGNIEAYQKRMICPICGKYYDIPLDGPVQCSNTHCGSRIVPEILHFIAELKLDTPKTPIRELVEKNKISSISDFMLIDEMAGETISTSIIALLRSLIPIRVLANGQAIRDFVLACTSNPDTVKYYVLNPGLIGVELGLHGPEIDKLTKWFEDGFNASEITTIMDSENVCLVEPERRFDGAPIFRDKLIYITGDFVHPAIVEILTSYSAKVTTVFSNSVDCVLVGGMGSNINGRDINAAKNIGIPISEELAFFRYYDIDSDLRNLV